MRYIEIGKLKETADKIGWDNTRQRHLDSIKQLTPEQRKKYINEHPDWNQFQGAMLGLSNNKCWYSEGPIGNNDFEVDHFRPKNKAKNHDGKIIKENGYWWKAYDWDNFRLTGALANKRRRDRLKEEGEVKGKGFFFPLDTNNGKIADDEGSLGCELPLLLDPANLYDVTLLTFDEKGDILPATDDGYEIDRVKLSIIYYHLDLEQLASERQIAWNDCVDEIQDAKKAIDDSPNVATKSAIMEKSFRKLRKLVTDRNRPYTCVSKACLLVYSELQGFNWLKNLVRTL